MIRPVALLTLIVCGCSSSDAGTGGSPGSATLDRSKKIGAVTAADLPLICDAWAAATGGYGAAAKTKDCGNAKASAYSPASQADCVKSFQANQADPTCTATVGGFVDCKQAVWNNPCVTVGEAPTCTAFALLSECKSP